ncbi:MAG: dihydroorotate dehydrogenase [Candidatus Altiarchaeota archaeon]|nr:dihydroorotate dehydrogenase [Candidatus Altiarchaeota archaeon]
MADISTSICGVRMGNPTVLAAGILGVTAASLARAAAEGAGAVTTKSIGPVKREGHANPVVVDVGCGLLNAVGLSCPMLDESLQELSLAKKQLKAPVIASFYGRNVEEFGTVAEKISAAKPDLLEANISCPNIEDEFGKPFSADPCIAGRVTERIKEATKIPLIVKLTPNVSDIKKIALSVEESGADCIAAINTLGPGMAIDVDSGKPVLSNKVGGLSGPAIKPIAVRCVYDISETVEIPVIGIGGIQEPSDVVEMLMAGASAVGVGTAVWGKGCGVFRELCAGLLGYMEEKGHRNLEDIIYKAHN